MCIVKKQILVPRIKSTIYIQHMNAVNKYMNNGTCTTAYHIGVCKTCTRTQKKTKLFFFKKTPKFFLYLDKQKFYNIRNVNFVFVFLVKFSIFVQTTSAFMTKFTTTNSYERLS